VGVPLDVHSSGPWIRSDSADTDPR
jgi:hypothetical protein